ncbi:MAG: hypothetical protein IKU07_06680 [Oscillospiraceae bacterium]|nr:hypothetical protein [Oscillospiraceae bacterium]
MKKYLLAMLVCLCFVLVLAGCGCDHEWAAANCTAPKTCELCGEIQGEAKGHTWVEATCTAAKNCSVCHITEGEVPGHNWEEATTETPKTCLTCQLTEGSKIQTDPRFTTEATKHIQGKWTCEVELNGELMGMPGYFESLPCTLTYEFGNAGDLLCNIEVHDAIAFMDEMKRMTSDMLYESFAAEGLSKEQADAAMKEAYGMSMEEYLTAYIDSVDMDEIFAAFKSEQVYYVGQNGIYSSDSWLREEFDFSEYTLENDVLIIKEDVLEEGGEPLQWKRAAE